MKIMLTAASYHDNNQAITLGHDKTLPASPVVTTQPLAAEL
jgi:hypothetical protein